MTAAESILESDGFARATTNRIAKRAGVNVALIYRYFAGKEAIVGALIERSAERTHEAVQAALEAHASSPLEVALRALVEALVDTPGMSPAVHRELVEHIEVTRRRAVVDHLRTRAGDLFAAFLAGRQKELRPFPDRAAALFVLERALEGAAHAAAFYRPKSIDAKSARDAVVELVIRALMPMRDPALCTDVAT